MTYSRRNFLKFTGFSTAALGSAIASASVVKSLTGAKNSSLLKTIETDYKLLFSILASGVPDNTLVHISDPDITWIAPGFLSQRKFKPNATVSSGLIEVDFPNVTQLGCGASGNTFTNCNLSVANIPNLENIYGSYNFQSFSGTELNFPLLTNFNTHDFSYSDTLKILTLPSVVRKTGAFFVYQDTALEHVYLPKMTLSALGGASYIAQQQCNSAAVFHLADGDFDYQGNPL